MEAMKQGKMKTFLHSNLAQKATTFENPGENILE